MEQLTLKELADLNRIVARAQTPVFLELVSTSNAKYYQLPDGKCPAHIQKARKRLKELTELRNKIKRMMMEAEY